MLEIKKLTKKYGAFTALDELDLTLEKGVYGLLGANGAGKTTFLNLLTDNIKRTSGEILYNGRDILELGADFRQRVGYTPQLQGIFEDFTAGQFMRYIGALKGMKRRKCVSQTVELLELVGLGGSAHRKLGSFSGGMRQRVLLAAAMLDDPEILIMDEPTAGLDPEERIRLRNHIAEISADRTVILATHVVDDIECIAERVILLKKGRLLRFAPPAELMDEIIGKVGEYYGSLEETARLRETYGKGQTMRRRDGFVFRAAEDELPESFVRVNNITLEDVYLYHSEGRA
ncbi:MAG: ATP-binding cassette domain-containing protein [Oscillospiraceae bacterium]|nr:ATP-binding cassette domain-containing protein [Ruminococcus sp.]MDE7302099.1 ATP-binding cassette domain-containing protein [Oscillospiraceae bacterium]